MYEVALINVFWNKQDVNTRYFSSVEEQTEYFEVLTVGKYSPAVNFKINDGINSEVYYKDVNRTIDELLRCNYVVVKKTYENNQMDFRYYFASVSADSSSQVRITLDLDDIQTNYYKHKDTIKNPLIERASLNRWKGKFGNDYYLNNNESSPFLSNEFEEQTKYTKTRERIYPNFDANESTLQNFSKGINWLYVFVSSSGDATTNYVKKICSNLSYSSDLLRFNNKTVTTDYFVLFAPINTKDKEFFIKEGDNSNEWNSDKLLTRLYNNDMSNFIYSIKVSPIPPLKRKVWDFYEGVSGNTAAGIFEIKSIDTTKFDDNITALKYDNFWFTFVKYQYEDIAVLPYHTIQLPQLKHSKYSIINDTTKRLVSPKRYNQALTDLSIFDYCGNSFSFDIQKLNRESVRLYFKELLAPDITKGHIFTDMKAVASVDELNSVYYNASDYLGLVYSNDTLLPIYVDSYSTFISNNKNFNQMQIANRDYENTVRKNNQAQQLAQIGTNAVMGLAMGNVAGAVGGATLGAVNAGISMYTDKQNQQAKYALQDLTNSLNFDNMKASPSSVKNSQGNVLFNDYVNGLAMFVEFNEAYPSTINSLLFYMYKNGYKYNQYDNLSNVDNIRKHFNYLEVKADTITASISDNEKIRLTNRLKAIRFWNVDTINYDYTNYEKELDND